MSLNICSFITLNMADNKNIHNCIGENDLKIIRTRFSWLSCALRGDEAVHWVGMGQQQLVLGGTESV